MRLLDDSELYRRSIIPRAFSHHVTDLQIMLWFSLLALIFLISLVWYAPGMRDWFVSMWNSVGFLGTWSTVSSASGNTVSGDPNAARITATAVLLGAWTGFAIRISTQVNERLGTVDLFLYQIVATCRVMVAVDMIRGFEILYDNTKLTGFANVARKEDYFSHFDSMGQAIGDLNRADVARTTEFFTYLKASRDATGSFSGWSIESGEDNPDYLPQARQEDVLHVVYLLFLVLEAAHYCIEGLARRKEKRFLGELIGPPLYRSYLFLIAKLAPADERLDLLKMKRRVELIGRFRPA